MRLEEFPSGTRLKMAEQGEKKLWEKVGSVKEFCSRTEFSTTDVYNWRNRDIFYPVSFVLEVLEEDAKNYVTAYKGGGRSLPVESPELPLPENDELLTRTEVSVNVNRKGVPFYQANERSLVERFQELLQLLGDVPVSVYSRSVYELRFPKHVYHLLSEMDYSPDFPALVDEEGEIENGYVEAEGEKKPVEEFDGGLFSRSKRLELALELEDSSQVRELIAEEQDRVREFIS